MAWRLLGQRIKRLRQQHKLSRPQLAEKTGLSTVYLKKLEAGERLSPSLSALERIAKALNAILVVDLKSRRGGRYGR